MARNRCPAAIPRPRPDHDRSRGGPRMIDAPLAAVYPWPACRGPADPRRGARLHPAPPQAQRSAWSPSASWSSPGPGILDAFQVWGGRHHSVTHVGGWAAPFGITLVADRLAAFMLVVSTHRARWRCCSTPSARACADGDERRAGLDLPPDLPDPGGRRLQRLPRRRPVQPLRQLRDPAHRVLRAAHPRRHRGAHPRRRRLHRGLAASPRCSSWPPSR